ncbi:FAD-dependent monooxygenase [Caldimonas thermodepolymerans]|uniref:Monooxygenase n=1 Tax=Caldimonas thermodepolymerans TaxID=215580 RepID=A0A2S5T8J1_9BURK|nr:FAD-dependent monooxygenase [Caldimonas thermodepolymerans]PPE71242.1 monooxygenase [Caldimonas thermodepolymerans]QPC32418.1 FAD-dependent monooxygenase [Caldimonas thermodepolymerans]RDH98803.1 salicylate hydroxylase [Caldimonas thermodepolymerans]
MSQKALVAGGGIGGLAVAIALLQRGIDVEVYEQAGELREVGAGIQISPNGNRALHSLNVFETLRALSCDADEKEIRLWNTGRTWKLFSDGDEVMRRYGFPYMTVFRPDLLRVLGDEVRRLKPDAIRLGARCTGVTQDADGVTLELADGSRVQGDFLVGADGVHSKVRPALFGEDEIQFTGMVVWRSLIPMDVLPDHMKRNVAVNWVGPGGHLVHYPVQGGKMMNFVGTKEGNQWSGPPWNEPSSREECAAAFEGWHEDIHTMIRHAPAVQKWALCLREFLPHWSVGRCTLLGDACHPTTPFLAQGAVMTLEDAVVLARCVDAHRDDIPAALKRYEALRMPRTYDMVRRALENGRRIHARELGDPASAEIFGAREWSQGAVGDRYEWLYSYQAETVAI